MKILQAGFETTVRSRLGVDSDDLPDTELNLPLVVDLAEARVISRVKDYALVTDPTESLYLQNACIAMICAIVCPSMPKRLNLKISISDVKLEKEKVDWDMAVQKFLGEVEQSLGEITSVPVVANGDGKIVGLIRNPRIVIGGDM